jgi:hypothetical protein
VSRQPSTGACASPRAHFPWQRRQRHARASELRHLDSPWRRGSPPPSHRTARRPLPCQRLAPNEPIDPSRVALRVARDTAAGAPRGADVPAGCAGTWPEPGGVALGALTAHTGAYSSTGQSRTPGTHASPGHSQGPRRTPCAVRPRSLDEDRSARLSRGLMPTPARRTARSRGSSESSEVMTPGSLLIRSPTPPCTAARSATPTGSPPASGTRQGGTAAASEPYSPPSAPPAAPMQD